MGSNQNYVKTLPACIRVFELFGGRINVIEWIVVKVRHVGDVEAECHVMT